LFQHHQQWVQDYGMQKIIPDTSFLAEWSDKIEALVITHGHEDHIGAMPWVVPALKPHVKIYAGKFPMQLIQRRMREYRLWKQGRFVEISMRKRFACGPFECVSACFALCMVCFSQWMLDVDCITLQSKSVASFPCKLVEQQMRECKLWKPGRFVEISMRKRSACGLFEWVPACFALCMVCCSVDAPCLFC
jgi:hypothetical protein